MSGTCFLLPLSYLQLNCGLIGGRASVALSISEPLRACLPSEPRTRRGNGAQASGPNSPSGSPAGQGGAGSTGKHFTAKTRGLKAAFFFYYLRILQRARYLTPRASMIKAPGKVRHSCRSHAQPALPQPTAPPQILYLPKRAGLQISQLDGESTQHLALVF